ncbi:MAG: phosphoribosylaminoimidazolesuccinocarboxamide synthase [Chthonomonadaceae bacterium]|nr:phosphoribosylaminoimidazolesuccinocarboxamide synthase [Chthonomonadaceae bacterium]
MLALLRSQLDRLTLVHRGKVRDSYELDGHLLIVASDRVSAFDVVMKNGIPDKGRILTQMSNFWFSRLSEVCPNHLVDTDDDKIKLRISDWDESLAGRCVIVQKAHPLPIECVARGYIMGSLYLDYQNGDTHGLDLPPGLQEGDILPEPVFTPATKAEVGHDINLSESDAKDLVGAEVYDLARSWTLEIYQRAAEHSLTKGLILADTKFEFGLTDDGLILIDEVLTPDSSRYWEADKWSPGSSPQSVDKQFVRDYLKSIGWDKSPPGPMLPDRVIETTRNKYIECYERITGQRFE